MPEDRLATEAQREAYARRRLGGGVVALLPEECTVGDDVLIQPEDLLNLKIDPGYQREKVTGEVNEIVHALESGGMIVQRAAIAVRENGDRYLADGQQKWWACIQTGTPLPATLYHVKSYDAEKKLFDILNNRRAVTGATKIKAWHGETGKLMQMLNDNPQSALRGHVNFGQGRVKHGYGVTTLIRGLTPLLHGTSAGAIRECLLACDGAYRKNPRWSTRASVEFGNVLCMVWPPEKSGEVKHGIAAALGRTLHTRWEGLLHSVDWPMPDPSHAKAIRGLTWEMLLPSNATAWVQNAVDAIEEVWPLPLVGGKAFRSVRA